MRWISCLLLAACVGAPSGVPQAHERASYQRLLRQSSGSVEADLGDCEALTHADWRGDCLLVVADRAGVAEGDPGRYCARLPEGVWRDECWFMAAEVERQRKHVDAALKLCAEAGRFRMRCDYHIWQEQLGRELRRSNGSLAELLGRMEPIYTRWAARLKGRWHADEIADLPLGSAGQGSFEEVFWGRVFQQRFERAEALTVTLCEGAGPRRATCDLAILDVARRRALDWIRFTGGSCEGLRSAPSPSAWWAERGQSFDSPPVLDAVAEACERAPPGQPRGGPGRPPRHPQAPLAPRR